jgi:hypothetical protein
MRLGRNPLGGSNPPPSATRSPTWATFVFRTIGSEFRQLADSHTGDQVFSRPHSCWSVEDSNGQGSKICFFADFSKKDRFFSDFRQKNPKSDKNILEGARRRSKGARSKKNFVGRRQSRSYPHIFEKFFSIMKEKIDSVIHFLLNVNGSLVDCPHGVTDTSLHT